MKHRVFHIALILTTCIGFKAFAQKHQLYTVAYFSKAQDHAVNFVSLTENYPFSAHPDSTSIASRYLGNMAVKNHNYHVLDAEHRKRFLAKLPITEGDQLFVYDFALDTVISYPVKNLVLAAHLNILGNNMPLTASEYHIGFELPKLPLPTEAYFRKVLVYVGKESPFVTGQVTGIRWIEGDMSELPKEDLPPSAAGATYSGKVYVAEHNFLLYMVQRMTDRNGLEGYRLVVSKLHQGNTLFDHCFIDTESTFLHSLNGVNHDYVPEIHQYTGKLFKDMPPMVYGFMGSVYGCDNIHFLKPNSPTLGVSCDKRY